MSHNDVKENTGEINYILTNYREIVTQTLAMETPEQYVEIWKLTIKTLERSQWHHGVCIDNFEQTSHWSGVSVVELEQVNSGWIE